MQSNRNFVLGATALLIFAVAAYLIFGRAGPQAELPNVYTYHGVCLACKEPGKVEARSTEHEPFECRKCKKPAFFGWLYCGVCKKRIMPDLIRDDQNTLRKPPSPTCPICKNSSARAYVPEMDDVEKTGDGPLPKWP